MAGISFTGLASGIDFDSLLSALMAVERQPLIRMNEDLNDLKAERDAYNDLNGRLDNLMSEVQGFTSTTSNLFAGLTVTSSDSSVVSATVDSTATAGTYDIRVKELAQAESVISMQNPSVGAFTSTVGGSDLDVVIESNITLLGSLHRIDNGASFTNADLGQITVDDGVSGPVAVDLSSLDTSANTFQDLVDSINAQLTLGGSTASAALNATNDGIVMTSGTGNLNIADADAAQTATKLGIATGGLVASPVDGGDLNPDLQADNNLSALNGGAGVADQASGFVLRNGTSSGTIDVSTATTVQDILDAINGAGLSTTAAVDTDKNGILLTSTVQNRSLAVEENGGTTALDLGILGDSNVIQIKTAGDASYSRIYLNGGYDGDSADLSMSDIAQSINAVSGTNFSSSVVDGRLVIQSDLTGAANGLQFIDSEPNAGILEQIDILITDPLDDSTINNEYSGDNTQGGYLQSGSDATFSVNGLVVTRANNTGIDDVITGVTLDLNGISSSTGAVFPTDYSPTTLTVSDDDDSVVNAVSSFVNQYNSVVDFIRDVTKINPDGEDGTLSGDAIAGGIEYSLSGIATERISDYGQTYRSIFEMIDSNGNPVFELSDSEEGHITLDETALRDLLSTNREDVAAIFADDTDSDGVYDKGIMVDMEAYLDDIAGSLGTLDQQVDIIEDEISDQEDDIDDFNESLAMREASMKREFTAAEQAIAALQTSANYFSAQMAQLS